MKATTYGYDPYNPAIKFASYLWIKDVDFESELAAYAEATEVLVDAEKLALRFIQDSGFDHIEIDTK